MGGKDGEGAWTLRLLGSVELADAAGAPVRLPTRKTLLVLAILAVEHDRMWLRQELATAVWPEADAAKARGSLRSALNALRLALPPNVLETRGDVVSIRPGAILCDATDDAETNTASGDFMPGFDSDWAIEHRLRLRNRSLDAAIGQARALGSAGEATEALAVLEEACRLDPMHRAAHEMRVRFLNELGRMGEASVVSEAFESKARREIEPPPPALHPLAQAAEWVLERNPGEALDLLASTPSQWFGVPLVQAVEVHLRVLEANPAPSVAKATVEAQSFFLQSLGGQTDAVLSHAGQSYERALGAADSQVSVRIAAALAFSYLAKGRFGLAIKVGRIQEQIAASASNQLLHEKAVFNLGVLEFHGGEPEKGLERLRRTLEFCEACGSEEGASMARVNTVNALLQDGKVDEEAASLSLARSYFERSKNMRMLPWVVLGEALVSETRGDLIESRDSLLGIRALGAQAAGYSAAAVAEDRLIRLYVRLGQWDEAAEAWARARRLRAEHGAVRTMWERAETLEARRALKERMGDEALQAVLTRISGSQGRSAERGRS